MLVERYHNNMVIKAEQCCSTSNVVRYRLNNVVQHCSWLLKQEKAILIEQACSILLSLLLNLVNKLQQYRWLNNAVTTLLSWLNNLVDNIVHWVQHNIVHCNRLCLYACGLPHTNFPFNPPPSVEKLVADFESQGNFWALRFCMHSKFNKLLFPITVYIKQLHKQL